MLIGIIGGAGRSVLAKYLVDHHRFVARNTLPKAMPSPGARVVVVPMDNPLATTRDRLTFARRVDKLGGIVVWLDQFVVGLEVLMPHPSEGALSTKEWQEREAASHAATDRLVRMMECLG